jgi:multidrug efflux pump
MTSLAFILGVVPLMLAQGAGAEMRRTLGTAVFSGMLGVTLFGIFLTPVFFFTIDWLGGTPLFASRAMQFAGRWSINILSLRPVREYAHRLRIAKTTKRTARPVASASRITEIANGETVTAQNGSAQNGSAENGTADKVAAEKVVTEKTAIIHSSGNGNGNGVIKPNTVTIVSRDTIIKK